MSRSVARPVAIGVTLALHGFVIGALLAYLPAHEALSRSGLAVIFVRPQPILPQPAPAAASPKPKAVAPRAPRIPAPAPIVTAPADTQSAAVAPPAPVVAPPPVIAASPAFSTQPSDPAPLTPPVFNADYLENPPPPYPGLSRRFGEQGRVILRILVDLQGRAAHVQLHASSGYARLDEAARATVKGWRFIPARRGAETVNAWVLVPISFRLEG